MNAGCLNRRVQIQAQSTTQDDFGAPVNTWNTVYTCWAGIEIQNTQLIYATAEFLAKTVHRITVRWTKRVIIQSNQRVLYTEAATGITHTYQIETLLNTNERNRELVLLAYELDAEQ